MKQEGDYAIDSEKEGDLRGVLKIVLRTRHYCPSSECCTDGTFMRQCTFLQMPEFAGTA